MSVKYTPVQWNRVKYCYDALLVAGTILFLAVFLPLPPEALGHTRPVDPQITNARAFGACAFVMLSIILMIGPLARLDDRVLPLLYNRRHFGVLTCLVALTHAYFVLNWYFAFSPTDKWAASLSANTSYGQALGFPFETLGIFALLCLLVLAATSHDFWLKFLGAPLWKGLHMLIYPAYAAVVGHIALGALQSQEVTTFAWITAFLSLGVAGLHLAAALQARMSPDPQAHAVPDPAWREVCDVTDLREGFAQIAQLPDGKRVAVFLHEGQISAISNACAHQNGPLGEGRIVNCLVTCPWHGFQYDVRNGQSPAPFTEKIPTYRVRLKGSRVQVDPVANPPGTPVPPVPLSKAARV
ncbi:MAG: ferric reductase-like transmembrane domain-containing protein [Rhodobacteraceae bacterium]|nr:ferric reductase-like transmembrane domain-containing protein [Paracoccaceae bacterium]